MATLPPYPVPVNSLYFLLGLVAFWSVFLTIVFRIEKRMVWPYSDLQGSPQFPDASGYAAQWGTDATKAGFVFLGWANDTKGPTYRISYAMFVSPDRSVFAVIGVGSILKMPLAATWLYTRAADGRTYYTTDKQTGVQIDLSRNWTNQLALVKSFSRLLERHREWLRDLGVTAHPFTQQREYSEFRTMREEHYRYMQQAGLIAYTDSMQTHFRFTFLGAAKTAIWGYFLGMARQVSGGRFPQTA